MKKTKIFAMLLSLACAAGFYSCSDDDEMKPALQNPTVSETAGAYNSLSFEWGDVANAVQYGYRLSDDGGVAIDAGVTHDKSVTFTGLQPATTYTLEVWAFAAIEGDYSTPPAVTLTATTDALIKLGTPADLALTSDDGYTYTATWTAVENAKNYSYSVRSSAGVEVASKTTSKTSVSLGSLENGDYTFTVYAVGYDGYETGSMASAEFNVDKPEVTETLYTVKGTYYSEQLNRSWDAYMAAYSDGTYSILAFYGVEGYNLDFKVDTSNGDDMFSFVNGEQVKVASNGYKTWQIPTGLSNPSVLIAYPWSNYCYMEGDKSGGEVGIGNYYGDDFSWGYDYFTWPTEEADGSVDDLVGTYNNHFVGTEWITDKNWDQTDWDSTWSATITKVSNNSVSVDGLFFDNDPVVGTVDFSEMTITFELKDDYYYYYRFASSDSPDIPAVGYINGDGSISVPDFGVWYDYNGNLNNPDWEIYLYGTSELTKVSSSTVGSKREAPVKAAKRKSAPKAASAKKPSNGGGKRR